MKNPKRRVLGRAWSDFLRGFKHEVLKRLATTIATGVAGIVVAALYGKDTGVMMLWASIGALLGLLPLSFLWSLACAPYRVVMDRCEDRISLLQQDKTTLEHDRDGYMGTCDMYKEQIRDLGAQIEKYRAAEASSFKVVREESDYLREAVSRVLVVIAQAKQGFALQFGRFGLPQSIAGDRQWGEVGRRLDLLWSEVAEYERIWKKRHPDRPPLGSAVIMVVTDLSEPLEPQRQRVEDAVRDIVDAIAEVRNRAEEHFRALMTMDKGLSQP